MKMTLKMDGSSAILNEGKPVYQMEDGKEFIADVPSLYGKTLELKSEAKRNRELREKAESQAKLYQDLFPDTDPETLNTWKQAADEALETVKNLKDKQLLDAGKVDDIKRELREAHDRNLASVKKSFAEKESEYSTILTRKDDQIFRLMVGNAFANSKFFSGREPLTLLPPDIALNTFGKNFRIQEHKESGELKIVGYFNGSEILSKKPDQVGEIASIDEAIEYLIDKYPQKERIMAAGKSGSGAQGGSSFSGAPTDELSRLHKQLKEAQTRGDGRELITIQNRIYQLSKQQVQT